MPEFEWQFTLVLLTNGVMIGLMYALIALGFGLERVVLRPLIGRPVIAVVMATIGLAAVLRGTATLAFGAGTRAIVMPIGDEPIELGPVMLPPVQVVGAVVSIVFLAAFSWFFLKSRIGIAMRAVADSQQVAMAMGIDVRRYFALAWAMAGVVSGSAAGIFTWAGEMTISASWCSTPLCGRPARKFRQMGSNPR